MQTPDTTVSPRPVGARRIAVIGSGYVGLTLSACLARFGHRVTCTDKSAERLLRLASGDVPIVEDGLTQLVTEMLASARLDFRRDNVEATSSAEFVFLCLPTPEGADGAADLTHVLAVATEIGPHLPEGATVVTKSTVPVGTSALVEGALGRADVHVASNPEFLAEGSAVRDCLEPDRIVVGARRADVAEAVAALYGPGALARSLITDLRSAELVKYASNAYLATRLTFVNSIAQLCESLDADIRSVVAGMGSDRRIGPAFLRPGPGWGGSCFPKDTMALLRTAEAWGLDLALVRTAIAANEEHRLRVVARAVEALGGDAAGMRVAVWGLTFKAGTDDLRHSPALQIAETLAQLGAEVRAYDPTVPAGALGRIEVHPTPADACEGADLLLVGTEWPEFASLDFERLSVTFRQPMIFDARNLLDPVLVESAGFAYIGIGIPRSRHSNVERALA